MGVLRAWFVCLAASIATVVAAEPATLEIGADKDFLHDWSAMRFSPTIGDFRRDRVIEFEERQTNLAGVYLDPETDNLLSIYIFRPLEPDVSIWFDRALYSIGVREDYFGDQALERLALSGFVPRGGTAESGRYAVLATNGRYKSTSLAIYRAGDWLIKLRLSSPSSSVPELEDLTLRTLAALPEMESIAPAPAYLIQPCKNTPAWLEAAPLEHPKGDTALVTEASLLAFGTAAGLPLPENLAEFIEGSPAPSQTFCRDGERQPQFNIYRPAGTTDRYIVALNDGGNSISVFPRPIFLSEDQRFVHRIHSGNSVSTTVFRPHEGLPDLKALSKAIGQRPMARVKRPLGKEGAAVTIFSSPEGEND